MLRFGLTCMSLLMMQLPVLGTETAPWRVSDHIPIENFVVQAHRGAGELAEENTLEAFELGWKLGCVPEADIRVTKDGVIVPFHDANFARVVKDVDRETAALGVRDVSFAELQQLDVGSWKGDQFAGRRVLALRDFFAAMKDRPERRLYLDIKEVSLPRLASEVRDAGVEAQVIFASTNYPFIREWKVLVPGSQTLLWMGGTEQELEQRFEELRAAGFVDLTQIQIHTHLAKPLEEITRHTADPFEESDAFLIARGNEVRKHGIIYQTLPWKATSPEIYWKLLDLGFMSFATDHPDVTWKAVRKYYDMN